MAVLCCACNGDNNDEDLDSGSGNKHDVAVTGDTVEVGWTTATVLGYINLNQLPQSVTQKRMGIVYWEAESYTVKDMENIEYLSSYGHWEGTNCFFKKNCLSVELTRLLPSTSYSYRTFLISSDGTYYFGEEIKTFVTQEMKHNVVVSTDVTPQLVRGTLYRVNIAFKVDMSLYPKSEQSEIRSGIIFSTNRESIVDYMNNRENKSDLKIFDQHYVSGSYNELVYYDTKAYYTSFTCINGSYIFGEIKTI